MEFYRSLDNNNLSGIFGIESILFQVYNILNCIVDMKQYLYLMNTCQHDRVLVMYQLLDTQSQWDIFHSELTLCLESTYRMDIVDKSSSTHLDRILGHKLVALNLSAYIRTLMDKHHI